MAEVIEWAAVVTQANAPPEGNQRFLALLDECVHRVRFVGNPIRYFVYIVNNRVAICGDPASCPIRAKYHIDPIMRYAANVLDRDEPDLRRRLKVVDLNPRILGPVAVWARAHKADPGRADGCDFNIDVRSMGEKRRYLVTPLEVSPFSDEEKPYIKANVFDLLAHYKAVPPDEIEERIFGRKGGEDVGRIVGGSSDRAVVRVARRDKAKGNKGAGSR